MTPFEALPESALLVLRRAKLVALDVDGVMTDGKVVYSASEETGDVREIQRFDVQDGIALRWLSKSGLKIVWITGRGCAVTQHRAEELRIDAILTQVESKSAALAQLQAQYRVAIDETVAMGDDLPDLGLRARAGFFAAPTNARPEVANRADLVLTRAGGDGAVRELAEHVLRAQGRWQALIDAAER